MPGVKDNLIKRVCLEYNLDYNELADIIGVKESTLRSSVSTNKISKQVEKAIELYLENKRLSLENEKFKTFRRLMREIITLE